MPLHVKCATSELRVFAPLRRFVGAVGTPITEEDRICASIARHVVAALPSDLARSSAHFRLDLIVFDIAEAFLPFEFWREYILV